jgi:lysine N6-hydroxylase
MEIDLIGVGVGPANLSLAALLTTARERGHCSLSSIFLERNSAIFWHSLQMFPGTLMQTEFYRDLVTPIDPTSRFSFLSYLKSNARLEQFFCSSTIYPTRQEFEDYFNWAAAQIEDIVFGVTANSVDYDPNAKLFIVQADPGSTYASKYIVLGYGAEPKSSVETQPKSRVADVSTLLSFDFPDPLQRVLVVGGGQSAAECIDYLLDRYPDAGMHITWATSETAFRALDISNFSRETFSASYARAFAALPKLLREKIIQDDKSIANGISPATAQALYQRLYRLRNLPSPGTIGPSVHVQANTEVLEIREDAKSASVSVRALPTGQTSVERYGCVILCTGLDDDSVLDSPMIGPQLKRRITKNKVTRGYAIAWDGPDDRMIFIQSQNKETHGLGDASFVTAPGRNASILNSITGQEIYRIDVDDRLVALR